MQVTDPLWNIQRGPAHPGIWRYGTCAEVLHSAGFFFLVCFQFVFGSAADIFRLVYYFSISVFNLFSNACKFTKDGEITVAARMSEDALIVSVADTGIGMTQAQQDSVQEIRQVSLGFTLKSLTGRRITVQAHFVEC